LYHLLNSYHLGTNRAIFFVQSRPHTVQQKDRFTFINGPQEIEGIQEFFLVVSRPKGQKLEDYCVDALLYTAHLDTDDMTASLMAPKTAESPWQDVWVGYNAPKKPGSSFPSIGDLALGAEILLGVPIGPDPATIGAASASTAGGIIQNKISTWISDQTTPPQGAATPIPPPYISPLVYKIPCISGWRIDRTRGLGGYDLWEDPDNVSATPLGDAPASAKPQASIDILSLNSPNDPVNYRPDYLLQLTAYVWPPSGQNGGNSYYHGRIKAYFIKDDSPQNGIPIGMFVVARGISTCSDSLFYQLFQEADVDIASEATIEPPNVAPWKEVVPPPSPSPVPKDASLPTKPIDSATPSGYDHFAVGAARAKMANSIAVLARKNLKTSFSCVHQNSDLKYHMRSFIQTDLAYRKIGSAMMASEITRLSGATPVEKEIANHVATHPAAVHLGRKQPLTLKAGIISRTSAPQHSRKPLPPTAKFPTLTLASKSLTKSDRNSLAKAGISSGLDLLDLSSEELASKLGLDQVSARKLRLRTIGLE